jgi:hypothetical protein
MVRIFITSLLIVRENFVQFLPLLSSLLVLYPGCLDQIHSKHAICVHNFTIDMYLFYHEIFSESFQNSTLGYMELNGTLVVNKGNQCSQGCRGTCISSFGNCNNNPGALACYFI